MLWFRRVSVGEGAARYTLQVPFQLAPMHQLAAEGLDVPLSLDSLSVELAENKGLHLLRVLGFASEAEAAAYLPKLHGALLRLTLVKRLSLRSNVLLQQPKRLDPPQEVKPESSLSGLMEAVGWTHIDAWVDPSPAVVIPEHLRVLEAGAGNVNVFITMNVPDVLRALKEGLDVAMPEGAAADERLALAVDLFAASLWDNTPRARVVSLSTTLEALLEPEVVPQYVAEAIDELLDAFTKRRRGRVESLECKEEFDRLRSRLANLKDESISRRLRGLAASYAESLARDPGELARGVAHVYDVRSKILHEGQASQDDVSKAAAWLQEVVPEILLARWTRCAETAT